jgi:hypothetical protein
MKKLMTVLAVIVALSCGQAMALYIVDIGTPASEAGFGISIEPDWGPVQPDTSGGNWGGLASDPDSWDNKCRVIWEAVDDPSATVTFPEPIMAVALRHLRGIANDSFDVDVDAQNWGSVVDNGSTEYWVVSSFSGPAGQTLMLTATGPAWSGFDTYGQVGVDWVMATVPGETYQEWHFTGPGHPAVPEISLNPYGTGTATVTGVPGGAPPEWLLEFEGREGVWTAPGMIELALDIPNRMIILPWKEIYVEIGFLGDLGNFSIITDPFGGSAQVVNMDIVPAGDGWSVLTGVYYLEPNPYSEELCFAFTGDVAAVDYAIVHTFCVPEPLTIALLGIGGLFLRRRRMA